MTDRERWLCADIGRHGGATSSLDAEALARWSDRFYPQGAGEGAYRLEERARRARIRALSALARRGELVAGWIGLGPDGVAEHGVARARWYALPAR